MFSLIISRLAVQKLHSINDTSCFFIIAATAICYACQATGLLQLKQQVVLTQWMLLIASLDSEFRKCSKIFFVTFLSMMRPRPRWGRRRCCCWRRRSPAGWGWRERPNPGPSPLWSSSVRRLSPPQAAKIHWRFVLKLLPEVRIKVITYYRTPTCCYTLGTRDKCHSNEHPLTVTPSGREISVTLTG